MLAGDREPLLKSNNGTYQSTSNESTGHGHSHDGEKHVHGHGHSHGGSHGHSHGPAEDEHMDVGDGGLRAVVFGFSDGLVTNLCLILGMLAGAASMAIGEWISMRIQQEASEAQLSLESEHIRKYPQDEQAHFREILKDNGMSEGTCDKIIQDLQACSEEQQVKWHGLMELGIDPEELGGNPYKAAAFSFMGFSIGALIPLLPWLFGMKASNSTTTAFYITIALSAGCTLALGLISGIILGLPKSKWAWITIRQLIFVVVATAAVIGCNAGISRLIGGSDDMPY